VLSPGVAEFWPSVLLMLRSADAVRLVVSVALSLPGTGSLIAELTLAVLARVPVAFESISQGAV
jgi:hypothetical protein